MRYFSLFLLILLTSACSHLNISREVSDGKSPNQAKAPEEISASSITETTTNLSKKAKPQAPQSRTQAKKQISKQVPTEDSDRSELTTNEYEFVNSRPSLLSQILLMEDTGPNKNSTFLNSLITPNTYDSFSSLDLNNNLIDSAAYDSGDSIFGRSGSGRNYEQYGFITPTNGLENVVNQELRLLRNTLETEPGQRNLVDEIRKHFKLDLDIDNKRIQSQLKWYVNNPNYLDRTFKRSARYLHHVFNEVKARNLPMELALLPFVESAYDPFAYSHGRASGLWQFIPGTGKMYGMDQNWWYDGRRDVLASTQGALDYLSYLHKRFDGNWLHALASYNSGSGRVSKAIKRNKKKGKGTDFWSLKLPKETRAYVPKLLALSKIVRSPEAYNIELPFIPDEPYFDVVQTGGQIDLAQAASLAKIDIKELYKLNPGFNQWASAPMGPHRLLIPIDSVQTFKDGLTTLPGEKRLNWTRYAVKRGDSLIRIAKKFNTTPSLIKQVNQLSSNMIREKQKLLIPVASQEKGYYNLSQHNRLKRKQDRIGSRQDNQKITHTVRSGDTMWDLAKHHKVGVRSLAKWNGMAPTDPIRPGQKLLIWSKRNINEIQADLPKFRDKRQMIRKIGYRVRKGDSLARIASKFSVSVRDLVNWNKLNKNKYLQPGQKLTIYVDITNT